MHTQYTFLSFIFALQLSCDVRKSPIEVGTPRSAVHWEVGPFLLLWTTKRVYRQGAQITCLLLLLRRVLRDLGSDATKPLILELVTMPFELLSQSHVASAAQDG